MYTERLSKQGTILFSVSWLPAVVHQENETLVDDAAADVPSSPVATAIAPPPSAVPPPLPRLSIGPLSLTAAAAPPSPLPPPPPIEVRITPCETSEGSRMVIMAPLALLWAPVAGTLGALTLGAFAIVETPSALSVTLVGVWRARRFGPIGKGVAWALAVVAALVMIPVCVLIGAAVGLTYGTAVGGQFLAADGSPDFLSVPVAPPAQSHPGAPHACPSQRVAPEGSHRWPSSHGRSTGSAQRSMARSAAAQR